MLNVIVKKKFLDRYSGVYHMPGDKLTITDARYREIKRSGDYVDVEKTVKGEKTVADKATTEIKK